MQQAIEELDICLECGVQMRRRMQRSMLPPFGQVRQVRCADCGFLLYFRSKTLVQRCPYRQPVERPTPQGKAPKQFLVALEATFIDPGETSS